jgi:hypothetical protein
MVLTAVIPSDKYKTKDWTTIYVSYIDMDDKCKRNEALNVVAEYKVQYFCYYVVQWSLSASSLFEI